MLTLVYPATCEENSGSIVLGISGGLEPYQIQWSSGEVNQTDLNNLSPGVYQVSVSDAIGNEVVSTVQIDIDNDDTAPQLACPENLTSISLDGNCEAPMPDLRLLLEVTDNCIGEITLSQFPTPGSFLLSGTTQLVVSFNAVFLAGNVCGC